LANFSSSPTLGDSNSYSYNWPSRHTPADDGSCGQNVAVAVLNANNIPIKGAYPARGRLCGIDINNMPAMDAINLSLAENMIDGKFIEVYADTDGFAFFQEIYPNAPTVELDIRTCVPTSSIDNKVDLVIVRGYDTPPVRSFKSFEELQWQEIESLAFYVPTYCQGKLFATEAWRSYKDPVLETAYNDGVDNLYELQEFESLAGYVIDFDGSTDVNVKYNFSNTTTKNVEIALGGWNFSSTFVCSQQGGTNIPFMTQSHNVGSFEATDKFGDTWPLLLSVQGVYLYGRRMIAIEDYSGWGVNGSGPVRVYVEEKPKLINLSTQNWHWELENNSSATIHLYYPTSSDDVVRQVIYETNGPKQIIPQPKFGERLDESHSITTVSTGGSIILNLNGALGFVVEKCIAAVEIDRPSCTVQDPNGNAIDYLRSLSVRYQPIVITDEPPPVAYTFGGSARLVDHTLDLYDSDPSTQQTPPSLLEGSLAWLQTQTNGRTVDISLPFASASQCQSLASTIYNMQNEQITSYSLVCGPSSEPQLGARVDGFEGRINKITESFQDGSSYNISVQIGQTFTGSKSWNSSIWQRKTSDVSREGIITWTAGNGIDYRVKVKGIGVYPAINKTLQVYSVGEKVKVTIHNLPQETL
jgi:hypothetical protein